MIQGNKGHVRPGKRVPIHQELLRHTATNDAPTCMIQMHQIGFKPPSAVVAGIAEFKMPAYVPPAPPIVSLAMKPNGSSTQATRAP